MDDSNSAIELARAGRFGKTDLIPICCLILFRSSSIPPSYRQVSAGNPTEFRDKIGVYWHL
jgi:hypothetical protein